MVERCERCGAEVGADERTVVLSNDARGEMREHVYCTSGCAMAPGTLATATLDAIAAVRADDGPGMDATAGARPGRTVSLEHPGSCPGCFEPLQLSDGALALLREHAELATVVCESCGEHLHLDDATGRLAPVHP